MRSSNVIQCVIVNANPRLSAALTLYQSPDHRPEHRSPLSGRVAFNVYPGLKHPISQSGSTELAEVLRRGWRFGVTYHNMRAP